MLILRIWIIFLFFQLLLLITNIILALITEVLYNHLKQEILIINKPLGKKCQLRILHNMTYTPGKVPLLHNLVLQVAFSQKKAFSLQVPITFSFSIRTPILRLTDCNWSICFHFVICLCVCVCVCLCVCLFVTSYLKNYWADCHQNVI